MASVDNNEVHHVPVKARARSVWLLLLAAACASGAAVGVPVLRILHESVLCGGDVVWTDMVVHITPDTPPPATPAFPVDEPGMGGMIAVPAGWFSMGRPYMYDGWGYEREVPVHDVYLDGYEIGRYPVTHGEYADILNWAHRRGYIGNKDGAPYTGGVVYAYGQPLADTAASSDYAQITFLDGIFDVRSRKGRDGEQFPMADHPVLRVTWYGAAAYCNWLSERDGLQPYYDTSRWERHEPAENGYRLPTEAEWERAAAWEGDEDGKHWIYGTASDTIDYARVNFSIDYRDGDSANPLGLEQAPFTSPVGWYNGRNPVRTGAPDTLTTDSPSPVGAYDMAGNVWEWCQDWYQWDYYYDSPERNPGGPAHGSVRTIRGGSWDTRAGACRTACRISISPGGRYYYVGFRIAR